MKSLGVRLAAGAITLAFGGYAAVVAQKDKQNSSTWSAEAPDLGEPATPIADADAGSWLTPPAPPVTSVTTNAEVTTESASPLQLVQHTEPATEIEADSGPSFDVSSMPATLADESDSESTATLDAPSWTLPPQSGEPAATIDAGAETEAIAAATIADVGPAMSLPTDATTELPQEQSVEMPEVQFGEAPAMDFSPAIAAGAEAASSSAGAIALNPHMAGSADTVQPGTGLSAGGNTGQPSNILRNMDTSVNALRAESSIDAAATPSHPAMSHMSQPQSPSGLAQDSPHFGHSAQEFDSQPQGHFGAPVASNAATAPQYNPQGSGGSHTGAGAHAGAGAHVAAGAHGGHAYGATGDRMASLPQGGGSFSPGFQPAALAQPIGAQAIERNATFDAPGDRRLEGAQTPSIIIQKRAPAEVKVGRPASFVIHVQNVGAVEALDVQVHDRVPAGMRLIDASPTPVQQGNLLLWQLGAMQAGDERTVTMQLVPEQEGELGSVARVSFEAAASVRTIATRPELKIVQQAPETVLIGQQLEIELEVSNPGSGEATGVVLQEDVPEGLEHPKGRQLDNSLGVLAPGEVRNQVLRLRAVAPGIIQNTIRLTADDGLMAEHTVAVQVVAPDLKIELAGPSRRFLERQATYQLNIANVGTADATNVELAVQLDRGFTFVSTDYEGQYDPSRHAVFWSLAQLPAGGTGAVPLTLLPVEEGKQAIVIDARADLGVVARSERKMTVEGFAELSFEIRNPGGPIEVGAETDYEIRVVNSGSKSDTNIQVQLQLPRGLELVSADSDAGTDGRGLVAFQPRAELPPGKELKFSLRLRGVAPGTHLVRAVVASDQSKVPVTKEESTLVYADQ